jgi:hypothetical protein
MPHLKVGYCLRLYSSISKSMIKESLNLFEELLNVHVMLDLKHSRAAKFKEVIRYSVDLDHPQVDVHFSILDMTLDFMTFKESVLFH